MTCVLCGCPVGRHRSTRLIPGWGFVHRDHLGGLTVREFGLYLDQCAAQGLTPRLAA